MPTGWQLKAARVLIGLEAVELAAKAKVVPSTIHRMEARGRKPVSAHAATLQAIQDALEHAGVQFTDAGGVEPIRKPRR